MLYDRLKSRIGFRLSGFKGCDLDSTLKLLAECGYSAVELCLEHPQVNPSNPNFIGLNSLKQALKKYRLAASSVSFHGKNELWDLKENYCKAGISLASELEVNLFITGSQTSGGLRNFSRMCDFSNDMINFAGKSGVTLALEPEPGTIIHDTAAALKLMNALQSEDLMLNLDIGHAYLTEKDLIQDILQWDGRIVHTHIEDIKKPEHQHLLPGDGEIDFMQVFRAFEFINYKGYYIIDLFDFSEQADKIARQALPLLLTEVHDEL